MNGRQRAVYGTYRGLAAALQLFPAPVAAGIATAAGAVMSEVWRAKRPLLRRNLRRVLGPEAPPAAVERCVRGAFDSYARYWVESARLAAIPRERLLADWSIDGMEHIDAALARGKGVVLVLPHLGSWEYAGHVMAEQGYPMSAVAEVLQPPELFRWFVDQRERLGISIVPLEAGSTGTLLRLLAENRILCLLADRDLGGHGVPVTFFGEETTLPAGPATLALRSGAALLTCAAYHHPGARPAHFAIVNPEIDTTRRDALRKDVARLTAEYAAELEVLIRRAPEQWHLFQPNWPSDRADAGRGAAPAGAT